jgi:hypothetical protein
MQFRLAQEVPASPKEAHLTLLALQPLVEVEVQTAEMTRFMGVVEVAEVEHQPG